MPGKFSKFNRESPSAPPGSRALQQSVREQQPGAPDGDQQTKVRPEPSVVETEAAQDVVARQPRGEGREAADDRGQPEHGAVLAEAENAKHTAEEDNSEAASVDETSAWADR